MIGETGMVEKRKKVDLTKSDDAGRMKFRGFPRRISCRQLWMNRIARQGPKWKPESAARML